MTSVGGKHKLVGFVDLGRGHDLTRALSDTYSSIRVNGLLFTEFNNKNSL